MKRKILGTIALLAFVIFLIGGPLTAAENEQVIKITAKKYEYSPNVITVKKSVPVVLEFTTLDRMHGFNCPGLNIRTDIRPDTVNTVRFVPEQAGRYTFHCDVFCGSGHTKMTGAIIITE